MATETLIPLESNPEVMNKLLRKLGVPALWSMVDVMGLDSDLLSLVPQPVTALMLLFPTSDAYEEHKEKEETAILSEGQKVSKDIFYMKQNISNACGTIALIHCIANNTDKIELSPNTPLKKFLNEAKNLDPIARGKLLENCKDIIEAHKELALEGQTAGTDSGEPVKYHFIAFVHKDGCLYELDGRKAFPINHGPSTRESFLEDSAKVCKGFMERDPNELRFTVVALV